MKAMIEVDQTLIVELELKEREMQLQQDLAIVEQ